MKDRLVVCVLWPSRSKRTGLASDGFVCFRKCSNHITKDVGCMLKEVYELHHRCGIAAILSRALLRLTRAGGGSWSINSSFILYLGKMNNSGINDRAALMQISTVTSCPLSTDDSEPTCFFHPYWRLS